jgi:hypothetical protein
VLKHGVILSHSRGVNAWRIWSPCFWTASHFLTVAMSWGLLNDKYRISGQIVLVLPERWMLHADF